MSSFLEVTKDGLKLHEWDYERKGEHDLVEKDGKVVVINRATKNEVFSAQTTEEAEVFFYNVKDVEYVWAYLHTECIVQEDVTLGDLFRAIEKDAAFKLLVDVLYPYHDSTWFKDSLVLASRVGKISSDGTFSIVRPAGLERITEPTEPVPIDQGFGIIVDDNFCVLRELTTAHDEISERIATGKMSWSLLEILDNLFGPAPGECHIAKSGLREPCLMIREGETVIPYLMLPCHVEDDVTLADIFSMVEKDQLLKAFLRAYSWCRDIDAFHAAAKEPFGPTEITRLEISSYGVFRHGQFDLELDFSGIGPIGDDTRKAILATTPEGEEPKFPETERYSVSFSSMSELAGLPIRVNNEFILEIDGQEPIKCTRQQTLLEILDAIYWDISFYGSPEETQKKRQSLIQQVQEIDKEKCCTCNGCGDDTGLGVSGTRGQCQDCNGSGVK